MDVFNAFATNETLELEGRWVAYDSNTKFLIARSNNVNYSRALVSLYKRHAPALKTKGKEAEALSQKLFAKLGAEHILLGWEGPVSIQGEDLGAYSKEKAERLLLIKGFSAWVDEQAGDISAYKAVQDEEDEKN